ncbi:MAG: nucleotide-binding universal stress UspA family protein, partial [Parvicellaceae bacterium]
MKKILVPIDFSSVSDDGLLVAKKLARITSAKIHIYHVMERSDIDEDAPDMEDLSENGVSSIAKLDALVHKRIDQLKIDNYQIHYELGFRSVYRSIIDKSEEINADLIVIGAFGVEGPQKFIGSNAERVIRMSSIPVLSIRGAVEDFYPTNMVFASQFLNEANMAYEKLKPFIKAHCSTVNLLRVV